jgi:hypothetical protein
MIAAREVLFPTDLAPGSGRVFGDSLADRVLGSNTGRVLRHAPWPALVA